MSSAEKIKRLFAKSEVTVNSKVDERIVSDALTAFDKYEKIQSVSSEQNVWRIIMKSRITKLASTAVIIAGVLVGLYLFVGPIGVTSVGWADVLKNIEEARTVTYIFEIQIGDVKEVFKMRIKEPYLCRSDVIESPYKYKVAIQNAKSNKRMTLYPNTKMVVINDNEGSPGYEFHAYEGLKRDFRDGTEKNLGRKKLNGRDTVCFEISKENRKITVWADLDTALPIQIEEISDENGNRKKVLRSDIVFDVELDDQLFEPPVDYCLLDLKTQKIQVPFELTEKHLIEGLAVYPKYLEGEFCTRYGSGRPLTDEVRKKCKAEVKMFEGWSDIEAHKSTLGCAFIEQLPEGSDYQYVGEDVKLGDAKTPVCWWKPPGSKTYRVVYGDLSIQDVEPSALPKIPWLTEQK